MTIQKEKAQEGTHIKKIIAIMSGKGGVGKSSITSLMAISLQNKGYKVGIMDADITGPSIPKIFGINNERAFSNGQAILPVETSSGIEVMSLNLLVKEEDDPVVWRGPMISGTAKRFFTDVEWGELDFLLIDMPPGTGDVPLTIMQSLPVDGVVVVSSPQDLVKLIVKKSVNMAKMMDIAIYGIVENMSYFICPNCNEKHYIFGKGKVQEVAEEMGVDVIDYLPIDHEFVSLCDEGKVELYGKIEFGRCEEFAKKIEEKVGGNKL
ncbi:Mrp/NBP35 family ATP-binding protein [Anaerophilus nitritogenes]|uniref:Mrp/NBP35 family ATP-binding protein n=1 Tax=Anaerophilus nitritogenes TaxID=2498136 RepID=UPI00101C231E|nr:Mrp/NBP35 family ATP-binding protein [Anaerophilus nitritogenes]